MSSMHLPASCTLCPRLCGANRAQGKRSVCGADNTLRVARAALHRWEEPPISGSRGSGTVFFSHCSLHCVFCQNEPLSSGAAGKAITVERLAQIFCELADQGAHNINLVTPTHYVPPIIAALALARGQGMALPVVYNTSGYETVATINALAGIVDIYLTDFKYASATLAARYSHAPDYPQAALAALKAMVEQVGEYTLGFSRDKDKCADVCAASDGILRRGVIVRHLLLPGQLEDAKAAVRRVFDTVGNRVCYSLMNQYTPMPKAHSFPELGRTVNEGEYNALIDFALDLGIEHSFMQEGGTATESYIPPFDLIGVEG